jgi:riboflavin kinase / FMN adenylyltransferase
MHSFTAPTIPGLGIGKKIGTPTINLSLDAVPADMKEGIYACFAVINGKIFPGVLHYGPRPVFDAETACEVHILGTTIDTPPETLEIDIIERIRDVMDFSSPEELSDQIASDITEARAILSTS